MGEPDVSFYNTVGGNRPLGKTFGSKKEGSSFSTKLQKIAEQARSYPDMVFTTLAHLKLWQQCTRLNINWIIDADVSGFSTVWITGCEFEQDAHRVMNVLPKRFGRFGLAIHPEKTVLTRCSKPNGRGNSASGSGTSDFLGFTHYWGKSRRGSWLIKRKTRNKSLRRFLKPCGCGLDAIVTFR